MAKKIVRTNRKHLLLPVLVMGIAVGGFAFIGVKNTFQSEASTVYSVPSSIPANCSTNVSAEINDWIATVPNGSTLQFPAGACYRSDFPINVPSRSDLVIEGNGAEFKAFSDATDLSPPPDFKAATWPRTRIHWDITRSTNITLRNVVSRGANTNVIYSSALEAQHGFNVGASTNVLLENVQAYDVYGDFVHVGGEAKNVTIRGGNFSGAGRQGFATGQSENLLFENFVMTRVARSAVDVEPELDWIVSGFTVRNGEFRAPIQNRIFANIGQGSLVENVTWENNRVIGKNFSVQAETPETMRLGPDYTERVPTPQKRRNYTFINNTSDTATNTPPSFVFDGIDNIVLRNNYQAFNNKFDSGSPAVRMVDSCGVLSGNSFPYLGGSTPAPVVVEVVGLQACATDGGTTPPLPPTADTTPPSASITSPTSAATVNATATINATAADNAGVAKVEFYVDGQLVGTPDTTSPYSYAWNTTTVTNGTHNLTAKAFDAVNNSTTSAPVSVTVNNTVPPPPPTVTIAPPTSLTARAVSSSRVDLTWVASPSTSVTKYFVVRNGITIAELGRVVNFSDTKVTPSSRYSYTVLASDGTNTSAASNTASVDIPAVADTTAPSIPTATTAQLINANQVNVSWQGSTDTGGSGLKGYNVYRNGTKVTTTPITSTSYGDGTVSPSTTYTYTITAVDNVGNESAKSTASSAVTTPATPVTRTELSGKVTDHKGTVLSGATVTLGKNYVVKTNSKGNYILSNVPNGTYTLTVSRDKYRTSTQSVSLKGGTQTINVNLQRR